MKVSFGQGVPARVSWISFLAPEMQTSNGFYPVYLFYKKEKLIGSLYLHSDNSIGLNSNKSKKEDVTEIIAFVKANHKPLPPIKSVRRGEFFINVSSNNGVLLKILKKIGKNEIQRSFIL